MRILADECCDARIVAALRADGHDVLFVADDFSRTPDATLLDLADRDRRLLLTEDKDFGRLVIDRGAPSAGVLLVRMPDPDVQAKIARVRLALANHFDELPAALVVVQQKAIRIRRRR